MSFSVTPVLRGLGVFFFGTAVAMAADIDLDRGKTVFQQNCALCHPVAIDAGHPSGAGQGPHLGGVVGRRAGSSPGFSFTKALSDSALTWDAATLDRFLTDPAKVVPGTSMAINLAGTDDRRAVIAYLASLPSPASATASDREETPAVRSTTDPADWQQARPGTKYHITVASLPSPYATGSPGNGPKIVPPPAGAQPMVPPGFTVKLLASGLNGPRLMRVAPNGDIFIAETRANRLRVIRAADGAKTPTENQIFADELDRPFGIAFYPLGDDPQWIYVAKHNAIVRFPYRRGDLKARSEPEVIVPKLTDSLSGHSTRDIAFSLDGKRLFISVGSSSNVFERAPEKNAEEIRQWEAEHGRGAAWGIETNRACILVTDPEGHQGLRMFATGIRNGVGIAVDPSTGELWTSTNERDGLGDDLVPDYITRVKEGGYYGWPWYYLGNHEDPRHVGVRPDLADTAIVPDVLIQAHSASLQMTFYPGTTGAAAFPKEYHGDVFAALHGSWNRNIRTGYKVIRVRVDHGVPTGAYEDFLTGFVTDNRNVWGRPVGVAVAHDGALLVTEDGNGTLWRVAPAREAR